MQRRSSTTLWDGIHWSEMSTDRVTKKIRIAAGGIPVIPVALYEHCLVDLIIALRNG